MTPLRRIRRPLVAGLLAVVLATPLFAAAASDCGPGSLCQENPRFSATLTDFRVLQTGGHNRPLSATLRLRNKTDTPLTLVYVDGSAAAVDEQGHRYRMQNTRNGLRGLGVATRREFDPRFTLGPGEAGDSRIEVTAYIKGVYGTRFHLELALREVEPLPGGQYRLGRETLLRFGDLTDGVGQTSPAAAPPGAVTPPATTPARATTPSHDDPCSGASHCVSSGPLTAQVERLVPEAVKGSNQGIVVTVAFRNLSDAPMILNYRRDSGTLLDEHGQRYTVDSRRRTDVQGMPESTRERASSQFTLAPGETRRAQFRYTRYMGRSRPGTQFSPSLAVEQYELLPSQQLRLTREHALDFGPVAAGGAGSAANLGPAIDALGRLLGR